MKTAILLVACCAFLCTASCPSEARGKKMTVQGEALVLPKMDSRNLCFDKIVKGSVVVRSTYKPEDEKSVVYKECVDYVVDYAKGTIARTETSTIPDYSTNGAYGVKDFDHGKITGVHNAGYFVWVDYSTINGHEFAKPNDQTKVLAKIRAKLEAGGKFTLVSYGDSITAGGEASTPDRRFQAMFGKYLQSKFPKAQIDVQDASISGYTSQQGIDWWDKYIGTTSPDLVLMGWGMNDHNLPVGGGREPAEFKKNLITLVGMIRERKGAEVIIYSTFPPNNDWHYGTHRMNLFAQAAKEAAAETKSAYVNVYDTWAMVLKRKDQSSLLANNINHPNDFGHWLYEQAFEAMKF